MQYSDLIYELDRQNTYNKEEGLPSSEKLFTYYMEMLNGSLFIGNYKIALQGSNIVILNKDFIVKEWGEHDKEKRETKYCCNGSFFVVGMHGKSN